MTAVSNRGDTGVERVLVVSAHPDDVDFGVAGSVAAWTDAGIEVTYCVVTDGDAGGFDADVPRSGIAAIRRAEQQAAAAVVGVHDIVWLGYPDGRVEVTLELRRDLARVIRQVRPERVLAPSPERLWDRIFASHPDHLAAGEATVCAVYPDARNPFTFPELTAEGLDAHTVGELWLMAVPVADTFVDITETFERKLDALRCHVSQEVDRGGKLDERMRAWTAATAAAAGWPEGRLAEGFRRISTG
ncbi:MAG TPA: PIG-L deacetylase family protein [Acidimicrobiales bacterium]|jgi:LmbE family N-acetylglucosaminyl deacetylase|nr:PIG-L deacetylase family protein [Acidimicrobiales bacterium]